MDVNIREYYDRGKIVVNLGCKHGTLLLVNSFFKYVGRGWGKWRISLIYTPASFTLLENMKIWFNIRYYPFRIFFQFKKL